MSATIVARLPVVAFVPVHLDTVEHEQQHPICSGLEAFRTVSCRDASNLGRDGRPYYGSNRFGTRDGYEEYKVPLPKVFAAYGAGGHRWRASSISSMGSCEKLDSMTKKKLWSAEICAGAGGQALGLEQAGFGHRVLVEWEPVACETLRLNRPKWRVIEADLHDWDASKYVGKIDLFAGGVPCPPYSVASKQLGEEDERNLFPRALDLVEQLGPKAVMLENVRGLLDRKFDGVRARINRRLVAMGYRPRWQLLQASMFGVSQLRPRVILVALREPWSRYFRWPAPSLDDPQTVGELLRDSMASGGWEGAEAWAEGAVSIAPTLVGGSTKHGGPDLGPTRAREAWRKLGVNGGSLALAPPEPGFTGLPRLTVPMAALVQGFPPDWRFAGTKTAAYRQVGNALPPPVARAVGLKIAEAIRKGDAHHDW